MLLSINDEQIDINGLYFMIIKLSSRWCQGAEGTNRPNPSCKDGREGKEFKEMERGSSRDGRITILCPLWTMILAKSAKIASFT